MKERPILFSAPMVRAILTGRKTQTRRVVKHQDCIEHCDGDPNYFIHAHSPKCGGYCDYGCTMTYPYGHPGDRLWVRETWRLFDAVDECPHADFPCGCPSHGSPIYRASGDDGESKWRPSIFMPRKYSRITLEIIDIRVQRLREISEEDAQAEGAFRQNKVGDDPVSSLWAMTGDGWRHDTAREAFASFWDVLNGINKPWCSNPWVWAVSFKRVAP